MIGSDGIKILDFGIAAVKESSDFTQAGATLGSAVWMSPEQITGTITDEWSDVFAMGLVLAYAATGSHPFGEGQPEAVMYRIDNGEPDLSGVSEPLRTSIDGMLSRD
jgi:serine/threonine protein kinase